MPGPANAELLMKRLYLEDAECCPSRAALQPRKDGLLRGLTGMVMCKRQVVVHILEPVVETIETIVQMNVLLLGIQQSYYYVLLPCCRWEARRFEVC